MPYWITVTDPIDMVLTEAGGTPRQIPFARRGTERIRRP